MLKIFLILLFKFGNVSYVEIDYQQVLFIRLFSRTDDIKTRFLSNKIFDQFMIATCAAKHAEKETNIKSDSIPFYTGPCRSYLLAGIEANNFCMDLYKEKIPFSLLGFDKQNRAGIWFPIVSAIHCDMHLEAAYTFQI